MQECHKRNKIMDGDLQNDPADIPQFLEKIGEDYDIVVGWRYERQDRLISRRIPSMIANWLIEKVTRVPIKYSVCWPKTHHRAGGKEMPIFRFRYCTTKFVGALGRVAAVPASPICKTQSLVSGAKKLCTVPPATLVCPT
jgi:hypothetical protein